MSTEGRGGWDPEGTTTGRAVCDQNVQKRRVPRFGSWTTHHPGTHVPITRSRLSWGSNRTGVGDGGHPLLRFRVHLFLKRVEDRRCLGRFPTERGISRGLSSPPTLPLDPSRSPLLWNHTESGTVKNRHTETLHRSDETRTREHRVYPSYCHGQRVPAPPQKYFTNYIYG